MKKYILLLIAVSGVLLSCNRDSKSLFEENATTRLNNTLSADETALMSAPNGWEMLYFPNTGSCGYNLTVKLNEDGQASVAACNSLTTNNIYTQDDNSTWAVKADYGPILSFDTYNTILHAWADPQSDGDGYLGDYEFLILSAEEDVILLKGKKHQAYSIMYPMSSSISWREYFAQVKEFNDLLFLDNNGMPVIVINADSTCERVYQDGLFVNPEDEVNDYISFITRPGCIRFYGRATTDEDQYYLNESKDELISALDPERRILPNITPASYVAKRLGEQSRWVYEEEGTDAETKAAVDQIKALAEANGAEISRIAFSKHKTTSTQDKVSNVLFISYLVDNHLYEGYLSLGCAVDEESVTFTYKDLYSQSLVPLLQRLASTEAEAVQMIADIFCDTFVPSSYFDCAFNLTQLNLQSSTDSGKNIHVIADDLIK